MNITTLSIWWLRSNDVIIAVSAVLEFHTPNTIPPPLPTVVAAALTAWAELMSTISVKHLMSKASISSSEGFKKESDI